MRLESYDQVHNKTVGTELIVNLQAKCITPLQPSHTGSCFANKQSILVQKWNFFPRKSVYVRKIIAELYMSYAWEELTTVPMLLSFNYRIIKTGSVLGLIASVYQFSVAGASKLCLNRKQTSRQITFQVKREIFPCFPLLNNATDTCYNKSATGVEKLR